MHIGTSLYVVCIYLQPKGLGVATRMDMASQEYEGLKPCGAGEYLFLNINVSLVI